MLSVVKVVSNVFVESHIGLRKSNVSLSYMDYRHSSLELASVLELNLDLAFGVS